MITKPTTKEALSVLNKFQCHFKGKGNGDIKMEFDDPIKVTILDEKRIWDVLDLEEVGK